MFKKNITFITIDFADIPGLFDYPKYLPLPRIGEIVHLNGKFGQVLQIKHITEGNVTEIKIICSRI
jgi:hypothetical protein